MLIWGILSLTLLSAFTNAARPCKHTLTSVAGLVAPSDFCSGDLVFSDDFNRFDTDIWAHEFMDVGANNEEFQFYENDRSISFATNGILYIKPGIVYDQPGVLGPVKSARIISVNSFSFKYGKLEIRAKMPVGDWLWPALWLMPAQSVYGGWPTSGEIDLVESRGNLNMYMDGNPIGVQEAGCTMHFGPSSNNNAYNLAHNTTVNLDGFHNDFHRYQMEWTPDYIKFSIDDREVQTVNPGDNGFWSFANFASTTNTQNPWRLGTKMAPFDQHFYVIMNVAVGGWFFPDGATNPHPKPWSNGSPTLRAVSGQGNLITVKNMAVNPGKALRDFWNARDDWLPTWHRDVNNGINAALQVDYVRVWAL